MKTISIYEVPFEVSQPYAAGHALTEAEAKALNQVRAENIANNMRKAVKDAQNEDGSYDAEKLAKVKADFEKYDAEYEFTLASTGGGRKSMSPLEREILSIARDYLNSKIKESGVTVKAYKEAEGGEEKYAANLDILSANEDIIKLAKKRLAERAKTPELEISL